MALHPEVTIPDPMYTNTDTDTDTDEEDNNASEEPSRRDYVTEEERYMASVRRAVMGLPEPESDPETDPEDYGPEMDRHYDGMIRSWLTTAASVTVLTAIALSVAITTAKIDNNNHLTVTIRTTTTAQDSMTTTREPTLATTTAENNMTTTREQALATTTAENNMTTTGEPTLTTMMTTTSSIAIEGEGLLILGGQTTGGKSASVELWHPSLPPCLLPDIPSRMSYHTVNSLSDRIITCYGDNCDVFQAGQWEHLVNTVEYRDEHSSIVTSAGILLLGGNGTNTTEVIPPTGEDAQPGTFDIRHGRDHCTIALSQDIAIVTGGTNTYDLVTSYTLPGGSPRALPSLQEGRWGHACTWYYRGQKKVLLVVGGWWDGSDPLASSESVTYSASDMADWTLHTDSLVPARGGLRAARIGETVYLSSGGGGNTYLSDILIWDPEHTSWSKVGDMAVARYFHAVTVVDYDVISQYCVGPSTDETLP